MKHIFGPVNSRRLGLSLGIDLLPHKICSFDCIYCELGVTRKLSCLRQEYVPTSRICDEIDTFFASGQNSTPVDVVTITASGEPTLHVVLGDIISHLKQKTTKPVAVLTNSSLLHLDEVRRELGQADILVPSLDAALPATFRKINRPATQIDLEQMIEGLTAMHTEFDGKFHLEVLLAKDINHSTEDIAALKKAIAKIQPDSIQLNTVARPPAEPFAKPIPPAELNEIARRLEGPIDIITDYTDKKTASHRPALANEILAMLSRRPCTSVDICQALKIETLPATDLLQNMLKAGQVQKTNHNNEEYYKVIND